MRKKKELAGPPVRPIPSEGDILREQLRGKVVKSIRLQPFANGDGGKAYDPVIIFTDGSLLGFSVEETNERGYGITPHFIEPTYNNLSSGWNAGDKVEHLETGEIRRIKKVQSIELGTLVLDEPIEGLKTFRERELRHIPTIIRAREVQ